METLPGVVSRRNPTPAVFRTAVSLQLFSFQRSATSNGAADFTDFQPRRTRNTRKLAHPQIAQHGSPSRLNCAATQRTTVYPLRRDHTDLHGFLSTKHTKGEVPEWGWAQGFSRSGDGDIAGCTAARATFRPGGRGKLLIISADTYMLGKHEINRAATFRRPHVPGIFRSHPAADIASAAGG